MFGLFKKRVRPKEIVCYPTEYHVVVTMTTGEEIKMLSGYGNNAVEEAVKFMDWFDKSNTDVFVGSRVYFRARNDTRITRRHVMSIRAWSTSGEDYYKNMGVKK